MRSDTYFLIKGEIWFLIQQCTIRPKNIFVLQWLCDCQWRAYVYVWMIVNYHHYDARRCDRSLIFFTSLANRAAYLIVDQVWLRSWLLCSCSCLRTCLVLVMMFVPAPGLVIMCVYLCLQPALVLLVIISLLVLVPLIAIVLAHPAPPASVHFCDWQSYTREHTQEHMTQTHRYRHMHTHTVVFAHQRSHNLTRTAPCTFLTQTIT